MITPEPASSKSNGASRRVLAILGMHRSGTSLAANVARELGAAMGQDLMPANDFNQEGYAEDIYVVQQHDQVMAELGRSWNTLRGTLPLPADWTESPAFDKARENLAAYLTAEFSRVGDQIWALKDPRISILLPLWLRLATDLGFELLPVLCVRNPDAVAASLEKRDAMPTDIGRLLWLQYNAAIINNIGQKVSLVLNYDTWFNEPNRNLSNLATILRRELTPEIRDKILTEVVSSDLRHHASDASSGLFGRWQSLLEKWAADQKMPPQLDQEARTFGEFSGIFESWRSAVVDENLASKTIDALRHERDQVVAAANKNLKAYREIDSAFHLARADLARLEQERDQVIVVADENLRAYRTLEQERAELIAVADENLKAYRTVDAALDAARGEIAGLRQYLGTIASRFKWFPLSLLWPKFPDPPSR
jgi:hypothetical protein